eukprot:15265070-Heterocapsa_arctica.AAC.1
MHWLLSSRAKGGRSMLSMQDKASASGQPSLWRHRCIEIVSLSAVEIAVDVCRLLNHASGQQCSLH